VGRRLGCRGTIGVRRVSLVSEAAGSMELELEPGALER